MRLYEKVLSIRQTEIKINMKDYLISQDCIYQKEIKRKMLAEV